jgi:ATP-dependent DNA helicase DinG
MNKKFSVKEILDEGGLLSSAVENFNFRSEQLQMAEFVDNALKQYEQAIIEAGTGTGKTFAYLVPALLSKDKVVISTGTKNLQEQLFHRDLPLVHRALKSTKKIALLKGRANYLCLYQLERSLSDGLFLTRQTIHELHAVRNWSPLTKTGDIAECNTIQEDASVWRHVTSTGDNCLGQDCPYFNKCHVKKARAEAQTADVLVVNHHLFMADLALKEEGFGELLPGAATIIFDEAHQLPNVATNFFGISLSSRQILDLAQDIRREYMLTAKDNKNLKDMAEKLKKSVQDCRLAFDMDAKRGVWHDIKHRETIKKSFADLLSDLMFVCQQLKEVKSRSKGLENCWRRCKEIIDKFKLLTADASDDFIHWFEVFKKHFNLSLTPMVIAENFQSSMQRYEGAWIFTSATIAIKNDFTYFANQLGLGDAKTLQLTSPFDFQKQSLIYIPNQLPNPSDVSYVKAMVNAVIPVLKMSKGRAFFLFTSFRALYEAEELLAGQIDYPLFVQGSLPKAALLDQFRAHGNAVLLGTNSFWEGVDVRGEALSCVIIDKLPFASPADPILKARIETLRKQGHNPFNEYQLPQAVISLKQGTGRLIRDRDDKGVMVICDPRILTRSYGKVFLNSLPKMQGTRVLSDVEDFFD